MLFINYSFRHLLGKSSLDFSPELLPEASEHVCNVDENNGMHEKYGMQQAYTVGMCYGKQRMLKYRSRYRKANVLLKAFLNIFPFCKDTGIFIKIYFFQDVKFKKAAIVKINDLMWMRLSELMSRESN